MKIPRVEMRTIIFFNQDGEVIIEKQLHEGGILVTSYVMTTQINMSNMKTITCLFAFLWVSCKPRPVSNVIMGTYNNIFPLVPFKHVYSFSSVLGCCVFGATNSAMDRFQYVQNSPARVLTHTRPWQHITPTLICPHWLPARLCIALKILLHAYKSLSSALHLHLIP